MSEKSEKEERKKYVRAAYAPDGPGALKMISLLEENGIEDVEEIVAHFIVYESDVK